MTQIKTYTQSYIDFVQESAMLHFLSIYFEKSHHPDSENLKQNILDEGREKNFSDHFILKFLEESDSEELFKSDTYELILNQMIYSRLSDNFLNYLKSILAEIIIKQPKILSSKDIVRIEEVLKFKSIEDFIENFTEKKIESLFYGNISSIQKFFKDRLGIELFTNKEAKEIEQLIKQRNLIVHNRGIINEDFRKKYKEFRGKEGILSFSKQKIFNINLFISELILKIDIQLKRKYHLNELPLLHSQ